MNQGGAGHLCRRPTGKGGECRLTRLRFGLKLTAPACWRHLTKKERAVLHREEAAEWASAARRVAELWHGDVPLDERDPACWAWNTDADSLDGFGDGACAICGTDQPPIVNDHSHDTGLRRGQLCRSCNLREGHRRDDGDHIWAKYRRCNPASILGIAERYVNPLTGVADVGHLARMATRRRADLSPVQVIESLLDRAGIPAKQPRSSPTPERRVPEPQG